LSQLKGAAKYPYKVASLVAAPAFIEIGFVNKYKRLGDRFNVGDENFKMDNKEVLNIANELGYSLKYSKGKEFHSEETSGDYRFKAGFTVGFNSFDFGLSITNEVKGLNSSAPCDFFIKLMTIGQVKVSRICFKNYDDIKLILSDGFFIQLVESEH
jgi:hypothetical protein